MNSILITGGELPDFDNVKHLFKDCFVCVADSGFDWVVKNNLEFDYIVGDMDSVNSLDKLKCVDANKILVLPEDKDDTDTLIGLKFLKSRGYNNTILIGGGGGRLDHLLGIFSIFSTELSPKTWYTKHETIHKVKGIIELVDLEDSAVSVFPLTKDYCSIKSYGLKWELDSVDWTYKSIGISNLINKGKSWIDSGESEILVILPILGKKFD